MGKGKKKREKQIPSKARLVLPHEVKGGRIIRPCTPHERRMASIPVFDIPDENSIEGRLLKIRMENDAIFQLQMRKLERMHAHHRNATNFGGSGFQITELLRYFYSEVDNRIVEYGFDYLPSSFNVAEAFFRFESSVLQFHLRPESEFLISADDFFDWYSEQTDIASLSIIENLLDEGVIYSYEMRTQEDEYRISESTEKRIAGISFVRHSNELTCMMLAGEKPPRTSDSVILEEIDRFSPHPGKEKLSFSDDLTVESRYLTGAPDYSKVVLMMRMNLPNLTCDVRYLLIDWGPSFEVLTDDPTPFCDMSSKDQLSFIERSQAELENYSSLFSAAMTLVFLPLFAFERRTALQELCVSTRIQSELTKRQKAEVAKFSKYVEVKDSRTIKCLPMNAEMRRRLATVEPPQFEYNTKGFWKTIGPTELGEDQEGNAIVGRTWVSRHEQWSVKKAEDFVLTRSEAIAEGPDPGIVYVQRCQGHAPDYYKIGLTRRDALVRAKELSSSTSSPLPFEVLASFKVGDCGSVEREIHRRLAPFRTNPRREFFKVDLRKIVETLHAVIREAE